MLIKYLINLATEQRQSPSRRELDREGQQLSEYGTQLPPPAYNGYPSQHQYDTTHSRNQYEASPTYPPEQSYEPRKSPLEIWLPRLRLMGAVFLPVILETLDYTSELSFAPLLQYSCYCLQLLRLLKPTSRPSLTGSTCNRTLVPPTSLDQLYSFPSGPPLRISLVGSWPWKHLCLSFWSVLP